MRTFYLILSSFLFAGAAAQAGQVTVTLNTSMLMGSAAGPFSLGFQLADGSLSADGNNAVVVSNVRIDGGTFASACMNGQPGDLFSSVNLTDLNVFGICQVSFIPGNTLTFDVFYTNNLDTGGIPDEFVVTILDKNNQPIPTTGGIALVEADFDSANPTIQMFPGDPTQPESANGGFGIPLPVATVSNLSSLPAPVLNAPGNGTTGVSLAPMLSWGASAGATSYDVYFGPSLPPAFNFSTANLSCTPGALLEGVTYYWQIVANNGTSLGASPVWSFTTATQPSVSGGLQFVPVTPCRVADTRNPIGEFGGPTMGTASTRDFTVPSSACGIPANALAYAMNITVVPQGILGYLAAWPAGQSQPLVSTLNSDGRVKASAAIVPAGLNGAVSVYTSNTSDVILDINGYFVAPATGTLAFYPSTPCRVADTRNPAGALGGPSMVALAARSFPVQSSGCGIPVTAQAYSLNMTVVPRISLGYLSTWPTGSPQPFVSTLNAQPGAVLANAAIVPAGTGGAIEVFATDATDVAIDINGYFAPPGQPGALSFYPAIPCRIADTRNPVGPFGGPALASATSRVFAVPSSGCGIPSGGKAYSMNATVVPPGSIGFLTLYGISPLPFASTLNDSDGTVVANAAIVPAASDGSVSVYTSDATHVILDINGYFAP